MISGSSIDSRRLADSYQPDFGVRWIPPLPRERLEKMTDSELVAYRDTRRAMEQWALDSPVASGWRLESWERVFKYWKTHRIHVILGGNRSSKSAFAARLSMWALGTIPEAEVRCYHVNKERSKQDQQRAIWNAMPTGLKNLPTKRGQHHTTQWNQANGFTGDKLILPPLEGWSEGGQINFSNYASYTDDAQVAEGFRAHLIWGDELMPVKLFETLKLRTVDFRGRIVLTFTVVDGWSPLIQMLLGKVRTLETRYAPLVKKNLPVLQENIEYDGMLIHYFWTEDNPFVPVDEFRATMIGLPEDAILARAYGVPTKAASAAFTKFSRDHNVVKHADLPFVKNKNYPVTRYMAIDPAGSKNWAMCWVAIDAAGTWWIYREWPDYNTYGEWALPGPTIEGKAGPAQRSLGYGIKDYAELMRMLEKDEKIFERVIDPRMGAAQKQTDDEGASTIISDLDKHDITVIPAPGVDIDNGIQLLQGLMSWNPDKPKDSLNSPKFYISEECENIIHAFCEYTAKAGPGESVKDMVDPIRYLAVSNAMFISKEDTVARSGMGD